MCNSVIKMQTVIGVRGRAIYGEPWGVRRIHDYLPHGSFLRILRSHLNEPHILLWFMD